MTEGKGTENKKLVMRTYDHDGNLLIDDIIDVDPTLTILNGLTSTLEKEEMIIVGTYAKPTIGMHSVFSLWWLILSKNRISFTRILALFSTFSIIHRNAGLKKSRRKQEKKNGG